MRRKVGATLAVLGVGVFLSACLPPPPPPPPPGPQLNPPPPDQPAPPNSPTLTTDMSFLTGLNNPWDMSFLPDGTMFFTERPGNIKVLTNGQINQLTGPDLPGTPDVMASGESGMMGIAVDPGFTSNHFIYTCYTTNAPDNRVSQWHVNQTMTALDARADIVVGIAEANFHDGCRVRFGLGGKLWVTTGDGGVGPAPQNINGLNGKVLRLNTDGSAPADNPFVNQPGDDRIFTYGHRNPQGIAFQPGTGQPYSIEHGPDKNDEVNRLVAGGNGGWDPNNGGSYDQSVPMTDLQKFPNAMIPAWRSGDSGTVAPSGGTFLTGSQWKAWQNQLVVAFLKDSKARVMFLDGNGNVSFATQILANNTRLRSAVEGPDGNLYISTDVGGGSGAIWKVTPS